MALPDNQHALFSDSGDNTVKLFNFTDGTVKTSTSTHTGPVRCLALLPGGLRFVSGSADGTTRITQLGSAFEAPVRRAAGLSKEEFVERARKMEIRIVKKACQRAAGSSGNLTRSGVMAELEALTKAELAKESLYRRIPNAEELDEILVHLLKTKFLFKTGRVWTIEAPVYDEAQFSHFVPPPRGGGADQYPLNEMEAGFDNDDDDDDDDDDDGNGAAKDYAGDDDDFGAPPPKRVRLLPDVDGRRRLQPFTAREVELRLVDPSVRVL